jgi:hypothetical protein
VWVLAGATLLTAFAGAAFVVALGIQSGDAELPRDFFYRDVL